MRIYPRLGAVAAIAILLLSSCTSFGGIEGVRAFTGHSLWVESVAWSPDSKYLASASSDLTVRVWDVATGGTVKTLNSFRGSVDSAAWSPDGRYLATGSSGQQDTLRIWDTTNWQPIQSIMPGKNGVSSVKWSPDGKWLAIGLGAGNQPNTDEGGLMLYDINRMRVTATFTETDSGSNLTWSPDSKQIAHTATAFVVVRDVSAADQNIQAVWHGNVVLGDVLDPDKNGADWSSVRNLIAAGDGNAVEVWDASNWQLRSTLKGHSQRVNSVSWSPDGKRLASGGDDGTVKIWDITSGQNIASVDLVGIINNVAWSPDGKYLAIASADHNVYVWDVSSTAISGTNGTPTSIKP